MTFLFINLELKADKYKVISKYKKGVVSVYDSSGSTKIGNLEASDTVDYVGKTQGYYIIKMKNGVRGYVPDSMTWRLNMEERGVLKSISSWHLGGKNIKYWLIWILFWGSLFYFIISFFFDYQLWFRIFTNIYLFTSLGCLILFGALAAKSYINFWVFDIVYPGREQFSDYFYTTVNLCAMFLCFFAIREAISLKGSLWTARTGSGSFVGFVYKTSMIAPIVMFFLCAFSKRLFFESFSDYLTFQFAAMWFEYGFWEFLMGWTTFLYMALIAVHTLYMLLFSFNSFNAFLWAIILPASCVIICLCIYFSLLKLTTALMTTIIPSAIFVWGIFVSGRNPIEWVHTHDIKDKAGHTVGHGFTAKPNVGKSHYPDRTDTI
jgi:hypothetical protein